MNPFEGFSDSEPDLEPRDYLLALKPDFDADSQLTAIRWLIHRNRKDDEDHAKEIAEIDAHIKHLKGLSAQHAVDDWVDAIHTSTYHSAAHSMSAVGMLAPLTETIFYQCFCRIGKEFFATCNPPKQHIRWNVTNSAKWDCHFVITNKGREKALARGIIQLAEALDLLPRLPNDLSLTLSALFEYRNNMFHNGFEWPVEERHKFAKKIAVENWPPDWFSAATTDNEPWIYYMTDNFIDHCMNTINQILDATGLFVKDVLVPLRDINQT